MFAKQLKALGRALMNGLMAYGCAMAPCPVVLPANDQQNTDK